MKIKVTGETKVYLDGISERLNKKHSHTYWVRGHWRILKAERYKENIGQRIWVRPHLRGRGHLIQKDYEVEPRRIAEVA